MNNKNVMPKQKSSSTINTNDDGWGNNDGWGDDDIIDDDNDDSKVEPIKKSNNSTFNTSNSYSNSNKGDPFDMMETKPAPKPIGGLTMSNKNKGIIIIFITIIITIIIITINIVIIIIITRKRKEKSIRYQACR